MNRRERIVVVGAGLCGLRAAERLRELGFEGDVVIVGDESSPPYHRPALSKQLLMGAMKPDDLLLPAYQNVHAKWRLNTQVQYLLPRSRTLRLPGEEELKYDGLIIATGVEARRQNEVPYEDPRILVLRTLPDALDLDRVLSENRGPVAVIGGGFTGCELASSLRHMGREVTLIGRGKNLLGNVLGQDLGEWLTNLHIDHGVDLALGNSVKRWAPREDGIALQLSDGSTMLVACVLLATGTVPSTTWLRGSGLPLDNGVVCEATCHVVGAEDVVAAGDVAQWPNVRFDTVPRRIEHWLNAIEMGRAAAENLLAGRSAATPFTPMPRFWTEQHGVRIQAAGVPKLGKDIVALGSPTDGTGTLVGYAKEGRLMGVVGVDCPKSVLAWTESIERQNPVPGEKKAAQPAPERPLVPPEVPANAQAAPAPTRQAISMGTRRGAPVTRTPEKPRTRGFAAKADQKKGRHSLPPREQRRPQEARPADWAEPMDPATAAALASASSARMMPAEPPDPRLHQNRSGAMVDSEGRLYESTGRIGRFNAGGGPGAQMGPGDSHARMRPAQPGGRMAPGPMMPGGRPGPEDSYERLPVVPPINDQLRSHGRLQPVDPRMGPEDSYDRMPPVDRNGRGPVDSNVRMRPANSFRPGPEDSYSAMPPAGFPVNGSRPGPVDSYTRLPPVTGQAYAPPQLNLQPWNGVGPDGRPVGPVDSYPRMAPVPPPLPPGASNTRIPPALRRGPVDSFPQMPPAGRQFGPVDSYDRMPPAGRQFGPVDSYDRMPPVNRQYGPEDSYDQFPPVQRGGMGPVESDGRLRPVQRRAQ
jgi:NADPH-dependent 2,4-dienoyl-CoA reductase/sulfur reductase-like enzyme